MPKGFDCLKFLQLILKSPKALFSIIFIGGAVLINLAFAGGLLFLLYQGIIYLMHLNGG